MKRLTNFFFLKNFNLNRQFSTIIKQNEQIFDIVIIGGGMVGSSLACALASTPITSKQKIALIDNQPFYFSNQQNYPDLRVSLLNHSSIKLLKAINCWKLLKETKRITPVSNMIVWDASGNGSIDFNIENKDIITSDNEDDDLMNTIGYMIENKNIQNSLFKILQSFSSVKIFSSSFIETIQISNNHFENNDWVNIELKDGVNLKTRLLVGADGYQSIVRKNCKFSTTGWSYNQIAIVASVEHSKNIHNLTAWQRFLPTGPLALLPMFENYSSIVWSTTLSDSHYLLSLSNDNFVKKLNESFIAPLSNLHFSFINNDFLKSIPFFSTLNPSTSISPPIVEKIVGSRGAFPLKTLHVNQYVQPRVALIGDAAHTIHPMVGQGVNLGYADVVTLAKIIIKGIETGQDIGSILLLKKYEEERKIQNTIMMTSIEMLKNLFDSNCLAINFLRNFGLSLTNHITPIKNEIIYFARGEHIDLSNIGESK